MTLVSYLFLFIIILKRCEKGCGSMCPPPKRPGTYFFVEIVSFRYTKSNQILDTPLRMVIGLTSNETKTKAMEIKKKVTSNPGVTMTGDSRKGHILNFKNTVEGGGGWC